MQATSVDIFNRYGIWNSAKNERSINPNNGAIVSDGTRILDMTPGGSADLHTYFTAAAFGGANPRGNVTGKQAAKLLTLVDGLTFPGYNHLNAKSDPTWQQMYHYGMRNFKQQRPNGAVVTISLPSFPCHYCGLMIPVDTVQVDHRQPQASNPGYQVAKVFHSIRLGSFDLTVRQASGVKNSQGMAISRGQAVNPIPVKGWDRSNPWLRWNPPIQQKLDRYTLTDEGKTFLTIAMMVHGVGNVESACVNSFSNLVPACPLCNRTKTNVIHAVK